MASITVAVALLASFPRVSAGQLAPAREYEIKAAFLLNFAKFIAWPENAFTSQTEDLRWSSSVMIPSAAYSTGSSPAS
jgi:hypothetical protein